MPLNLNQPTLKKYTERNYRNPLYSKLDHYIKKKKKEQPDVISI